LAKGPIKQLLLDRFMETKKRFGLVVAGYVLLDDHAHFLFCIPAELECTAVMNDMRAGFLRTWRKTMPLLARDDDQTFWEHGIEYRYAHTREDLRAYLDFIHYDPVRHGLVSRPADYLWSSLPARIEQGHYSSYWGVMGPPASIARVARECATAETIST